MLTPVTPEFEAQLRAVLPAAAFRDPAPYLTEPRGRWQGQGLVVAPSNTDEVAAVVRACAQAHIGIVPYSGGTGLVGGQIMGQGPTPVVLTLDRMTKLRAIYPDENVMVVDAGMILADVHTQAAKIDRMFPLSLASEGSARIGGLLATNAGGVNVLRYGNARAQCLGLEVVLANGDIWHGLTRLRKDNTGYDLRDLMIGSEGTLGIITAAALRLVAPPAEQGTALLSVTDPTAALDLLKLAQDHFGDGISAFELMHRQGLDFLNETGPDFQDPFTDRPTWMVLIDVGLAKGSDPQASLMALFEAALAADLSSDGTIAQNETQRASLWSIRETIPEANRRVGSISSHDISLPLSAIPEFITKGGAQLAALGDFRINCFGHMGDGNLHYNVFPAKGKSRADHDADRAPIKRLVHDLTHKFEGSVSAEHGIGRLKVDDLETYADPTKLTLLRTIKTALDPQNILNPGALFKN